MERTCGMTAWDEASLDEAALDAVYDDGVGQGRSGEGDDGERRRCRSWDASGLPIAEERGRMHAA
jgi:hypothetical protein